MTRTLSFQTNMLRSASLVIQSATEGLPDADAREVALQILEAASARIGGFDIEWYWSLQNLKDVSKDKIDRAAESIVEIIGRDELHPALALSALATPIMTRVERRKSGAYFTDFRLAQYLCRKIDPRLLKRAAIVDPACGAGILLVGSVLNLAGKDRKRAARLIASQIFGIDKDRFAVRASALSLSALTSDKQAITSLHKHLIVGDSLLYAEDMMKALAPKGFGAVISNPPWEQIKTTRHEHMSANGVNRHYGADYNGDEESADLERDILLTKQYSRALLEKYNLSRGKEIDLYSVFFEMSLGIISNTGQIAMIVPAGFIRSQGTELLRRHFFYSCSKSEVSIFDNRARFFAIDTRFKFLTICGRRARARRSNRILLRHPHASEEGIREMPGVSISLREMSLLRDDLSVPEVRSDAEWRLFKRISTRSDRLIDWGKPLGMNFCRELDMTRDRYLFKRNAATKSLPLIEGRMVHQYASSAKKYIRGTGRKAKWDANDTAALRPQFWVNPKHLSDRILLRTKQERIGFCDITGQTNERSMMAALVPPESVCGNKVPTIVFEREPNNRLARLCFIAVANSLLFDWIMRRLITTTVNYFILEKMPFPRINLRSPLATRLGQLTERLLSSKAPFRGWAEARLRLEIEVLVAKAYGVRADDLRVALSDFPLLDRSEPVIPGEARSTITRDATLLAAYENMQPKSRAIPQYQRRVTLGRSIGAVPFRPSHLVAADQHEATKSKRNSK